ncbi:uncharacterized protein [Coffea arabica]|uniref:RNase H type-1 domain-containing protein n=1 Tax=Coffea arabica TaxID=13443 RepID=A0ABM4WQC8_COFAR
MEYKQMWDLEKMERKKDDPEVPAMTITKELQDQHATLMFTDAAMDKKRSRGGLGITTKDHNGKLVKAWAIPTGMMKDAAILEAEAIRSAMLKALEEGWTSLLIHSDCKGLVDRINHKCFGLSLLDVLVEDIVHLRRSFWRCSFIFIGREYNRTNHDLAKFAINLIDETRWELDFPVWLRTEAHKDVLAVCQ